MNELDLGSAPVGRLIARFAIPSVVAMLVNALYNIVDQIFIGRGVGYLGNGAANVVLLVTMLTLALSLLVGDGAAALYSLRLGAGEGRQAARCAGSALTLITVLSLTVTVLCLLFLQPILRLFGCTDTLMPPALDYGYPVVLGMPFIMIATSLNSLIRADGSPRYAMAAMMAGAVFNGCMDPVFIFGLGWGIRGAAAATLLGQGLTFLLSVAYLPRFRCVSLTRSDFRPHAPSICRLCALGISSFIDQVAFTLVMAVNNNLIVRCGAGTIYGSDIPLTAYGIAMKVQEILFTLVLGLAIGMQPVAGYNYGAKQYGRVRRAYGAAVCAGTVLCVLAALLFVLCPEPVIGLFGSRDNALYLDFSRAFFQTYFLLYPFFGFLTISGIFFQAIGKPSQAAGLSLAYQGLKMASALLLCSSMGLFGVLWSGPAADLAATLLSLTLVSVQLRRLSRLDRAGQGR